MAEQQYGIYYIEGIAPGAFKIYEQRTATMYLVCGTEKACLIDTAFGLGDLKEIAEQLGHLPVTVVNTHGHSDHVLGNQRFYDGGNGRVYMHPADRPLYEGTVEGFMQMFRDPAVREQYGEFLKGVDPESLRFPQAEDLREGDVIDLGGKKLEVVEIPGHTAGSILLLDRAEKICYSGDAIIENLWLFLDESLPPEVYLASLRHARDVLTEAGIERIYDGHFSYVPLTTDKLDNMIAGMEQVIAGTAEGEPFENDAGRGIRYFFGDWSVLCREKA